MEPGGRESAPGGLGHVQAFVNTLDLEAGVEVLDSAETLGRWLRRRELLKAGERLSSPGELDRARDLREALRALLRHTHSAPGASVAAAATPSPSSAARAALRRESLRARLALAPGDGGDLVLQPRAAGLAGALGRLLVTVVAAQADGTWERLRVCANDRCQWAFYDASRNRSGRWCSMAICGNRSKVRTHRLRGRQEVTDAT